jgi:hypothetical protein
MQNTSDLPVGGHLDAISAIINHLSLPEKEALERHAILGTDEGTAYDPVASLLFQRGLISEDPQADGFQRRQIALTEVGKMVLAEINWRDPADEQRRTNLELVDSAQRLKREVSTLQARISQHILATARAVGFRKARHDQCGANSQDLDLLTIASAHCSEGRTGRGAADVLVDQLNHQISLRLLSDPMNPLGEAVSEGVATGLYRRRMGS